MKAKTVTAPMLSFDLLTERDSDQGATHKINLWVLDVGQFAELAEPRSFHFGDFKSAGLVYEENSHGHYASEVNVYSPSTWAWIAKWMERGFLAERLMRPEDSKHWDQNPSAIPNAYISKDSK